MSLVPFRGQRPSSTHPDTLRTVQAAGRLARQFYDWYQSRGPSPQATIMSGKTSRSGRSGRSGGGSNGMAPANQKDLQVKPPSMRRPMSVPKQVTNQVIWDIVKLEAVVNLSAAAVTEANSQFNLSLHPQVTQWTSLFDQWAIPQASVTYRSLEPPGSLTAPVILVTAIDFDNVGNLGSVALLEDFSTAEVMTLSHGAVVTRSVKPAVKTSTQTTGANSNGGLIYPWIDSSFPTTLHFGLRAIATQSAAAYNMEVTTTIWYCFRNQI